MEFTKKNNEAIAIIGSGEMAVLISENAKRIGLETHTFSNNMFDRVVGISKYHHNVSIFNIDEIYKICVKIGVTGVIATTELTISVAAELSKRLNLVGLSTIVSKKITDKSYVRKKLLSVEGVFQPDFLVVNPKEIPEINKFPVVIKPTSLGGKRGVTIVEKRQNLAKALEYSSGYLKSAHDKILIEEFIPGTKEYSIESLSYKGSHYIIQITEKISSGPPYFAELGHIQPADISSKTRLMIEEKIRLILNELNIDNTATHVEIKIFKSKIYLIEVNTRLGGDYISYPLTELSTGYPYLIGAINIALGRFQAPVMSEFNDYISGIIFITKQTSDFLELFKSCDNYPWLYKKNEMSQSLVEIINNKAYGTNYFIFISKKGIPKEIKEILYKRRTLHE